MHNVDVLVRTVYIINLRNQKSTDIEWICLNVSERSTWNFMNIDAFVVWGIPLDHGGITVCYSIRVSFRAYLYCSNADWIKSSQEMKKYRRMKVAWKKEEKHMRRRRRSWKRDEHVNEISNSGQNCNSIWMMCQTVDSIDLIVETVHNLPHANTWNTWTFSLSLSHSVDFIIKEQSQNNRTQQTSENNTLGETKTIRRRKKYRQIGIECVRYNILFVQPTESGW